MARVCKIVLVCEGWRDQRFAVSFLKAAGINPRSIEPKTNPSGSGYDWVKRQFLSEVKYLQQFREGRGVLGIIDEDGQGDMARVNDISNCLRSENLPVINPSEGRCLLLPKRNIETWLYWLTGQIASTPVSVDEVTDYKNASGSNMQFRIEDNHCSPAGEFLHSLNHTDLPAGCPIQLQNSLVSLRNFLNAVRRT